MTACQNPNVASEPGQVNFACGKTTSQILWVFALMTSGNNPQYTDAKTGRQGLEPITPTQGGEVAWSLNLHHPYNPMDPVDSLEVAARAVNNIIGGATLTSTSGKPAVQPGLESNPANCAKYTGSPAVVSHAGFPSLCAQPVTTATGQAALVADAYRQWVVGATPAAAYDVSVLFANANDPGKRAGPSDPQDTARRWLEEPDTEVNSVSWPSQPDGNAEEGDLVQPARKPTWQQATALVSLSTCGAMTGFAFAHGSVDEMTSPTRMPVHLLALDKPARPASAGDAPLRAAIVKVAKYYLRMAQSKSPAEMEAVIWGSASVDGADHGQSCAAFASLTLALGAKASGQASWVTGGSTYPWALRQWADVRVDPNPASPEIISVLQDAQAHHRWHPLGDGYRPQPGDWVTFDGHVEVVTSYSAAALDTIGGDSGPNLSVNAHTFTGPLAAQGVTGFVNNGGLLGASSPAVGGATAGASAGGSAQAETAGILAQGQADPVPTRAGGAAVPGTGTAELTSSASRTAGPGATAGHGAAHARTATTGKGTTTMAGTAGRAVKGQRAGGAAIPGLPAAADDASLGSSSAPAPSYTRNDASAANLPDTAAQQAFISEVAPGAIAAQSRYGIPAAVTIAQAIDESGWGQSVLAIRDHNLFGIKGSGPAGTDMLPTREYENGRWVTRTAPFRVYHNVAESIADHGQLLASGPSYQHAMADRHLPDAFATDLTGVYATDPQYGANLIAIMRLYNLYHYGTSAPAVAQASAPAVAQASAPAVAPGGTAAQGGIASQDGAAGAAGAAGTASGGAATIPGVLDAYRAGPARPAVAAAPVKHAARASRPAARAAPRRARTTARASRYVPQIPRVVTTAFITAAKAPLSRAEPLYDDVASRSGIRWELLAACDWMQCQAQPRYSPVYGEKLGTVNAGGTVYRTKFEALGQCASDLIELAMAVYWLDITARRPLSVRDLAKVFAAFRWGGLLRLHGISAMEFPYSVEGLTAQHVKMRWPGIKDPNAPDKPGTRFRLPFGAVPVVLCLGYPAIA